MVDEITDISNCEQVVLCLRWVDDNFNVHEDTIGLYKGKNFLQIRSLVALIKDALLRMNLSLNKARGQCYVALQICLGLNLGLAAAH